MKDWLDEIKWDSDGLVPAIAQDYKTGHVQTLHEMRIDCDADVVILKVEQIGDIACHTGRHSCFYRVFENGEWKVVEPVLKDPHAIYSAGH